MKARILVIEDEKAINDLITMNLQVADYEVVSFYDGLELAQALPGDHQYDIAVVDVMLPGKDGFQLMEDFKKYEIPVIYLTAKTDLSSKVTGLRNGAEDYMVKPFEMLELLTRIEKILIRCGKQRDEIHIHDVCIYPKRRMVTKAGEEVALKPMEFDCLMMLVDKKNIALTRDQLLTQLWGMEFQGETRTIDVHIGRIRKKLGFEHVIRTIPRIGYRLEVED